MKIAILTSGGVDSSTALALLAEQGHDLTAFYLKIWLEDELSFLGTCPWEEDLSYVQSICNHYNIPLEILPLQRAYWERVVTHTLNEVKAGRTPNPDILCNQQIKFGVLYDAINDKYEKVATGHYARTGTRADSTLLLTAPDPIKDQTYFLAALNQTQLQRALFPIGTLTKNEVRQKAQQLNLPNAQRKDSQGICFLGKLHFETFLRHHLGTQPGKIIDTTTGKNLGEHEGYWFYTIGQRRGIRLGGGPWFVVRKDCKNNIIFVTHADHYNTHTRSTFSVHNTNWIITPPSHDAPLTVKLRHGPEQYPCTITPNNQNTHSSLTVNLKNHSDLGIAPGQFAVFYHNDECLGGGTIAS